MRAVFVRGEAKKMGKGGKRQVRSGGGLSVGGFDGKGRLAPSGCAGGDPRRGVRG